MNQSDIARQIDVLRATAGFVPRAEVYTLVLTGVDRVAFLNGMVTSDVSTLAPGQGQKSVKATPKGRVEGVLRVRCTQDALYVDVEAATAQAVANGLAKMIIMEEVTLSDGTDARAVLAVYGPAAAEILQRAGLTVPDLPVHHFATVDGVTAIRDDSFGIDGYELHVPAGDGAVWSAKLTDAGAVPVSAEALDVVRVESAKPRDGVDIDDDTIPMEARLDEALDFKKGCFVGQEVIARAHNLGGVKHIIVALAFEGDGVPAVGSKLTAEADGKDTGEVTSAVFSPTLGKPVGLGFVRTAHQADGTALLVGSADAPSTRATVTPWPQR